MNCAQVVSMFALRPGRYIVAAQSIADRLNRRQMTASQFILQSACKPLRLNAPILGYFTTKCLYCLTRNLTLIQRVQGPCTPTNEVVSRHVWYFPAHPPAEPLIPSNWFVLCHS